MDRLSLLLNKCQIGFCINNTKSGYKYCNKHRDVVRNQRLQEKWGLWKEKKFVKTPTRKDPYFRDALPLIIRKCWGKNCYDKRGAITAKNRRWQEGGVRLRIYPCNECHYWHVTHKIKKIDPAS